MLNGLDPLIIFQFKTLADTAYAKRLGKIPIISDVKTFIDEPPIPVYLSADLTGVHIDTEDKSVDIATDPETTSLGTVQESQKGVNSSITINLIGSKGSVGLILLSSLIDIVYKKVTSEEYAITYLNGATTIFRGKLQSFSANQSATDDLLRMQIILSRGQGTTKASAVDQAIGADPASRTIDVLPTGGS